MKLQVFSQNMWLLPFRISANNNFRFLNLIEFLQSSDFDLISLQEVWLKSNLHILKKSLENKYQIFHHPLGISNTSGLVTTSEGDIAFLNTHLYAYKTPKELDLSKNQFGIVLKELGKYDTAIIAGDLNMELSEKNLSTNPFIMDYSDKSNTISQNNRYNKMRLNRLSKLDKKIDYVLLKSNELNIKSKVLLEPNLSDHYGVIAEIK